MEELNIFGKLPIEIMLDIAPCAIKQDPPQLGNITRLLGEDKTSTDLFVYDGIYKLITF